MDRVVTKIRKSAVNEVWVVLSDFTGELRLDLREYFHAGPAGCHPTKKGVSIPTGEIRALRDALEALSMASDVGTVATIHRTQRGELQAGIRKFEGHTYAELRMFIPGPTPEVAWRPTPKGFTLKPSLVPLLAEAVGDAEDLLNDGLAQPPSHAQGKQEWQPDGVRKR